MPQRFALFLLTLLTSACCNDPDSPDCTVQEKREIEAARTPALVAEQDGVRLYRVRDPHRADVYFTTPCGDASWETTQMEGKISVTEHHQVNGTGCR